MRRGKRRLLTSDLPDRAPETPSPRDVLDQTFVAAKQKDEFEYVCALLRIRGLEDAGWDRLEETAALVSDMVGLARGPLPPHTRVRLGLLTYCHVVEADPIYEVTDNMLRTIEGLRCSVDPFRELYRRKKPSRGHPFGQAIPPSAKQVIQRLGEHARQVGQEALAQLLEWMFHDGVRNAFFHSDYILYKDEFRSRGAVLAAHGRHSLSLKDVEDVINRGLAFYAGFMQVWRSHRLSYKESKVLPARLGHDGRVIDVQLLVDPRQGLCGFQSV